jgi:hypothetical protein
VVGGVKTQRRYVMNIGELLRDLESRAEMIQSADDVSKFPIIYKDMYFLKNPCQREDRNNPRQLVLKTIPLEEFVKKQKFDILTVSLAGANLCEGRIGDFCKLTQEAPIKIEIGGREVRLIIGIKDLKEGKDGKTLDIDFELG